MVIVKNLIQTFTTTKLFFIIKIPLIIETFSIIWWQTPTHLWKKMLHIEIICERCLNENVQVGGMTGQVFPLEKSIISCERWLNDNARCVGWKDICFR
jgi:hypothetical protein